MVPFPTRRSASGASSTTGNQSSILPTTAPNASSYPPARSPTSNLSPRASFTHGGSRASSPDLFAQRAVQQATDAFEQEQHVNGNAGSSPSSSSTSSCLPGKTPQQTYGTVRGPGSHGCLGGLGVTHASTKKVIQLLQDNHVNHHTFFNDEGFHNHAAHHLLASYSVGAGPALLDEIYQLHTKTQSKPMLPIQPVTITEDNWLEYLGDERMYPNFLRFFMIEMHPAPDDISPYYGQPTSVIPVLERYLLGGQGDMLARSVSGAIHGLINIGYGLEFGINAVVAEGLAQTAVTEPKTAALFPESWPPAPRQSSGFSIASAFSSLRFGSSSAKKPAAPAPYFGSQPVASLNDSFAKTAAKINRERRTPRNGLSGFMILDRILNDPYLAPGRAGRLDDNSKLDGVLHRESERIVRWCEEWRFEGEGGRGEWDEDGDREEERRRQNTGALLLGSKVPSWDEIVEKTEELFWLATVIFAASSRPGFVNHKLDFFLMHGLTSVLFLPPILEVVSPHLRPYLLTTHFRILVAYWVSRGRPELHVEDVLMSATAYPRPPHYSSLPKSAVGTHLSSVVADSASDDGGAGVPDSPKTPQVDRNGRVLDPLDGDAPGASESSLENPWPRLLASAADHPDDHLCKVIRSLAFGAMHFGHSPAGYFTSSLPGSHLMDGSIFVRAAGLTMRSMGWCHEGEASGSWDRSCLGYDEAWDDEPRDPNYVELGMSTNSSSASRKGKSSAGRSRSGTETEETYLSSRAGSVAASPVISQGGTAQGWYQSSTPERSRSPVVPETTLDTRVLVGGAGGGGLGVNGHGGVDEDDDERERRRLAEEEDAERELMA